MKRGFKIMLIVAACFFAAGLIAAGIGFAAGGFQMFTPEKGVEKSYTTQAAAKDLEKIYVDISNGDIHFQKSENDNIMISYYDYEKLKHTVTEEDGVLQIIADENKEWYDYLVNSGAWINDPITVYVPESFDGEIAADTSNGDMVLTGLSLAKGIDCHTSNGEYQLSDITAESVKLKTSNGEINLQSLNIKESAEVKTSNGEIEVYQSSAESMDLDTSNGSVILAEVTAPELIKVKSSNGELEVIDITSDHILLDTSLGDVTGTICGKMSDYQIISDGNSDNNLPENKKTGSKKLEVDTSVGKIDIHFTED